MNNKRPLNTALAEFEIACREFTEALMKPFRPFLELYLRAIVGDYGLFWCMAAWLPMSFFVASGLFLFFMATISLVT